MSWEDNFDISKLGNLNLIFEDSFKKYFKQYPFKIQVVGTNYQPPEIRDWADKQSGKVRLKDNCVYLQTLEDTQAGLELVNAHIDQVRARYVGGALKGKPIYAMYVVVFGNTAGTIEAAGNLDESAIVRKTLYHGKFRNKFTVPMHQLNRLTSNTAGSFCDWHEEMTANGKRDQFMIRHSYWHSNWPQFIYTTDEVIVPLKHALLNLTLKHNVKFKVERVVLPDEVN